MKSSSCVSRTLYTLDLEEVCGKALLPCEVPARHFVEVHTRTVEPYAKHAEPFGEERLLHDVQYVGNGQKADPMNKSSAPNAFVRCLYRQIGPKDVPKKNNLSDE